MSIATLAKKVRAQKGASTRTGWTLATTKSGNCPGPCGGGAPAKQRSFRRLMKNKARPGVEMPSVPCCARTQKVFGDWNIDENALPSLVGKIFIQSSTRAQGTLIGYDWEGNDHYGHGIFQMVDCQSQFDPNGGSLYHGTISHLRTVSVDPPNDTFSDCACCPPVATWKKTNNPKGRQSIGDYIWRKKQLTHNCIKDCTNENPFLNTYIIIQHTPGEGQVQGSIRNSAPVWSLSTTIPQIFTYGDTQNVKLSGTFNADTEPSVTGGPPPPPQNFYPPPDIWSAALDTGTGGAEFYGYIYYDPFFTTWIGGSPGSYALPGWRFVLLQATGGTVPPPPPPFPWGTPPVLDQPAAAVNWSAPGSLEDGPPPSSEWNLTGLTCGTSCPPTVSTVNWPSAERIRAWLNFEARGCSARPCDNVGCKCNCNKSMGGTACCVVHKTILPRSNSENIPWTIQERTCLQIEKTDPRNPNTC